MINVGILGVGSYLPVKVLTNKDLEKMVDTTDEWITTRTGIKERRIASDSESTSDLASKAALEALKKANMKPEDIELLIVATITPDMFFPSTACIVQGKIGAKKAACFDISAACTGYIYAMATAVQFIKNDVYKNALIIGAEKLSSIIDWTDRNTCVLFGDGAGAAVLGSTAKNSIVSMYLASDGNQADLLKMPAGGSKMPASHKTIDERLHFLKMEGSEVFKIAVKAMADAAVKAINGFGLKAEDINLVIPHQANLRILMAVARMMGLSKEKIYLNIEKYGNMSGASTAVALAGAITEGRVKRGDIVVLDAFGSGFTWGAIVIKW
jgi:3-oxoacyl-[acyl-carrier-protein] synthase-3